MAISAVQTYLSPEEYITLERKAKPDANTVRNEYIQGKIIAMSGASFTHNLIKGNGISRFGLEIFSIYSDCTLSVRNLAKMFVSL